jgi:hypothetical protein
MTLKQENQSAPSGPSKEAYKNLAEKQVRQEKDHKETKSDAARETPSSQNSQPGSGSGS